MVLATSATQEQPQQPLGNARVAARDKSLWAAAAQHARTTASARGASALAPAPAPELAPEPA
eukprot:COSAG06_NODE_14079_length_1192_cov_1.152790_2_plen_61_part_01